MFKSNKAIILFVVRYFVAGDQEYVVRKTKTKLLCECSTYKNLNICDHIMKVIKMRGIGAYQSFIKQFRKDQVVSSDSSIAKKPTSSRRGGRNTARVSA